MRWRVVWHDGGFQCRDFGARSAAENHSDALRRDIGINPSSISVIGPTLADLAREAIEVQNACNLSGVVRTYGEVLSALRDLPECTGTSWINSHPIAVAFADKISDLVYSPDHLDHAAWAHDECLKLAEGK